MVENFVVASKEEVFAAVIQERDFQDRRYGGVHQKMRQVPHYLVIMQRHLDKAAFNYADRAGNGAALDEIRKVIAVGFACLEEHGVVYRKGD
jgi:hypothetical protein